LSGSGVSMVRPPKVPSLRAQVVLWNTALDQIWRLMWGLVAAARQAREAGLISSLELAFGDCWDTALPDGDIRDLQEHGLAGGLAGLTYEFFDENLGHSGGQNRLALQATADALMFINPDTYPAPTMISELAKALQDPRTGIAEARQIPFEHPKAFDPDTGATSWASGCCMAVPRRVFEEVGGFSPEFFPMHCDDVDLSWRVKAAGYRLVHAPAATVLHHKRLETSGYPATSPAEVYHSTLGRLMLCVRYSNPALLQTTIAHIEVSGDREQKDALLEFRRRSDRGALPEPLPEAGQVAQFLGGEYAEHRY
jgi:GT2 family glycosyltransferase